MTIDEEEQLEMPDGEFNTFMRDIFELCGKSNESLLLL